jgi:hypothetical protein
MPLLNKGVRQFLAIQWAHFIRLSDFAHDFSYPGRAKRKSLGSCYLRWYASNMSSKLSTANPYLRDPVVRQRTVLTSVSTSSAIEGIRAPFKQATATSQSGGASSTRASAASQFRLSRPKS